MKAKLFVTDGNHQSQHATWCADGLLAHGWVVDKARHDADVDCDLAVVWGWRRLLLIENARQHKVPILVMERGHIQPRMEWTSMGFDGLGRLGRYAKARDHGQRFSQNFGHMLKPWKEDGEYVLVMGQVSGDASLHGLDIRAWENEVCEAYRKAGHKVVFRPHPLSRQDRTPPGIENHAHVSLDESLRGASQCVIYSSTSGVEAALSGVPVVSLHPGAMAWPISAHRVLDTPLRPDRKQWTTDLSWTQFLPDEIRSGFAWECLRDAMQTA